MFNEILKLIIGGVIFLFALAIIGTFPYTAIVVLSIMIVSLFLIFNKNEY